MRIGILECRLSNTRGTVIIEAAIALPIIFIFFFAILWLATVIHATTTVHWLTGQALRLGITRGDTRRTGSDVSPVLSGIGMFSAHFDPLYSWPPTCYQANDDRSQCSALRDFYDWYYTDDSGLAYTKLVNTNYKNNDLDISGIVGRFSYIKILNALKHPTSDYIQVYNFPPSYAYALAYANNLAYESLGRQVRYPCDPLGSDAITGDGPGCFNCVFSLPSRTSKDIDSEIPENGNYTPWVAPHRLVMECTYAVDSMFMRPIGVFLQSLGITSNISPFTVIVRSKKMVDIEVPNYREARL